MKFKIFTMIFFISFNVYSLEYSKIDFDGCPENSYCKKETGQTRKKWIDLLKTFTKGNLSEQKFNNFIQSEIGIPLSGWASEEASLQPNILMWDSPCKQHKNPSSKYYIMETFRKNLISNELKENPFLVFSKAIMKEGNETSVLTVPRGDAPLFIKNGNLYFLREDEGIYYGLLIDREGKIRVTTMESTPNSPKEVACPNDLVVQFQRLAPSPNFYQGQYCKEIWDKNNKTYKTVILGWSCN